MSLEVVVFEWVRDNTSILYGIGLFSAVAFIGTLIAIPFLIIRISPDYFMRGKRESSSWQRIPAGLRFLALGLKNLLGIIFILAGLAMLVLPGQGILTIFVGVSLLHFPGKARLALWILRRPPVLEVINRIRSKAGREPLQIPERT